MTAYKRPAPIISVKIMVNSFVLIPLYLPPHPISYFPLVCLKIARVSFLLISESCLSYDTVGFVIHICSAIYLFIGDGTGSLAHLYIPPFSTMPD